MFIFYAKSSLLLAFHWRPRGRIRALLEHISLTRAPLGYSAECAPLEGADSAPPCLTSERRVVERREKRQTEGLNKFDINSTTNFAYVGHKSGQGQVKGQNYKFSQQWRPSPGGEEPIDGVHPERILMVRRRYANMRYALLKTLFKVRCQVRSPKVITK